MGEVPRLVGRLALFTFALVARRLADGVVRGPMIFLALGLSRDQLGCVQLGDAKAALHVITEVTLVVVVFATWLDLSGVKQCFPA